MRKVLMATKTTAYATGGSDISDCIDEAIVMSIQTDTTVEFEHNERTYWADPATLRAIITGNRGTGE